MRPDITGAPLRASSPNPSPADARDLAFAIYACGPDAVAIYIDRIREHITPESAELLPTAKNVDIAPFEPIGSVALRIVAGLTEMGRAADDRASDDQ